MFDAHAENVALRLKLCGTPKLWVNRFLKP